jgi:hypothetical protein
MPTKLGINSKHKLSWNITSLVIWIHYDFMLNSFKQMMLFFKGIRNGYKFFIMNFVIKYSQEKTYKNESLHDEENCFFQVVRTWCLL